MNGEHNHCTIAHIANSIHSREYRTDSIEIFNGEDGEGAHTLSKLKEAKETERLENKMKFVCVHAGMHVFVN